MHIVILFIVPVRSDIIPRLDQENLAKSILPFSFQGHDIMEFSLETRQGIILIKNFAAITGEGYVKVTHFSFFLLQSVLGEDSRASCMVAISKQSGVGF